MNTTPDRPVALITGSGRPRVGKRIARRLGEQGYRLALHYHHSEEEAKNTLQEFRDLGMDAELYQADVSQEPDVDCMFDAVQARFGRLDAVITTASIWKSQPLEQLTADDLRLNFNINTLGTFLCVKRAGLIMARQQSGGTIVTMGDWAIERPYPDYAAYFVSKGAIPTLTKSMAVELAARNPRVRVNCIHPGPVMAPSGLSQAERQARRDLTLVKQADDPDTVANAVIYFVKNPFITGVCLLVDGGRTLCANESASLQ